MTVRKPDLTDQFDWQGTLIVAEVYKTSDIESIDFKQVQAVCLIDDNQVVLYEHRDGWCGLPGGHIEPNESIEDALRREIREEISAKLRDWNVLGYEEVFPKENPADVSYFLRCRAHVKLLDEPTTDPDGKVVGRMVLPLDKAQSKIGYGQRGQFWLKTTKEMVK